MISRRSFLAVLAGLPFVGKYFAAFTGNEKTPANSVMDHFITVEGRAGEYIETGQTCYLSDGADGRIAGLWYATDTGTGLTGSVYSTRRSKRITIKISEPEI